MRSAVRRVRLPAILVLASLVVILGVALFSQGKRGTDAGPYVPGTPFNAKSERAHWTARVESAGGQASWEELKHSYAGAHFGIQHTVAHLFGEILYDKLGLEGVTVCDSTFAFGCYHSFFGASLAARGPDIIKELDAACVRRFGPLGTGCQHGIGHGLMEFYGSDGLVKALEGCTATTQVNPLFGCTGGVFMEYNVPIVLSEANAYTKSRTLDPDHPYAPCDTLPERFRKSCYYEMGQWWDKVYERNYAKLGSLCAAIRDPEYRDACYLGVGNVAAPSSEYDVALTIQKCESMPDPAGRLTCRSGASWSMFAEPKVRDRAPLVCADLSEESKIKCARDSDLMGNGERAQVQ